MSKVRDHLSVSALEDRLKACTDATAARHVQVIWLLAQGHSSSQVSAMTAFGERWIQHVLERYNAEGPEALGDLRRRTRLTEPLPDGGLWSSRKVAAYLAEQLGLETVAVQRG